MNTQVSPVPYNCFRFLRLRNGDFSISFFKCQCVFFPPPLSLPPKDSFFHTSLCPNKKTGHTREDRDDRVSKHTIPSLLAMQKDLKKKKQDED